MASQSRNIVHTEQVAENDVPVRIYNCPHCDRSFNCSQAVAGHCKGHYSRNQTLKPPRQRNHQHERVIPTPAVQPLSRQTVLPQLPNRELQSYNHNPQFHLHQRVQVYAPPQFPAYYVPFTDSLRVTDSPIGGVMNNFERGSTSNGNQARNEFGEQNGNEELDLALHL